MRFEISSVNTGIDIRSTSPLVMNFTIDPAAPLVNLLSIAYTAKYVGANNASLRGFKT